MGFDCINSSSLPFYIYRSFAKKWRVKIDLISLLLNKFS